MDIAKASAAIVHRVPVADVEWFLAWQRGTVEAAQVIPGYRGTDIYPPADDTNDEWVAVIHFESDIALRRWLESPVRMERVEQLRAKLGEFQLKTMAAGFSFWFADAGQAAESRPAAWKMALTVVLGLYPTVMLLNLLLGRYTAPWGLALAVLTGNVISVSFLQWAVMPLVTSWLAWWLNPSATAKQTVAGCALVLVLIGILSALFHQVIG